MNAPLLFGALELTCWPFPSWELTSVRPDKTAAECQNSGFSFWPCWAAHRGLFWVCTPFVTKPGTGISNGASPPFCFSSWPFFGFGGNTELNFYNKARPRPVDRGLGF